jgi:hypothetical protein
MITYEQAIETMNNIDFDSLKFPIYRKDESNGECYRFDSIKELISIRRNNVVGIGVSHETSKLVFAKIYSFGLECSKEEFDGAFECVFDTLKNLKQ